MAASDVKGPKPPPRAASLQRVLDLEKKYKLARLHNGQAAPVAGRAMSFQSDLRPSLQARRRDSRESLAQQQKQQGDPMLKAVRRNVPLPSLSITIPPPENGKPPRDDAMPSDDQEQDSTNESGDVTPRERTVAFLAPEDDAQSVQSSICQSPSWEGYGERKKKKKLEAEQRRKEKEKVDQEQKAARRKAANRLFKPPPPPQSSGFERPATASAGRPTEGHQPQPLGSHPVKYRKSSSSVNYQQRFVPEACGIAIGAGGYVVGGLRIHQPYPLSAPKAPASPTSPKAVQTQTNRVTAVEESEPRSPVNGQGQNSRTAAAKGSEQRTTTLLAGAPTAKASRSPTTNPEAAPGGISYPPPSSRTHTLRHTTAMNHGRSNSISAPGASKMEEVARFFKAQSMKSSQSPSKIYTAGNASDDALHASASTANDRGRQKNETGGYVRQSRAQSAERSLSGFLEQFSLSNHGPRSPKQRPSSSHSRLFFSKPKGEANGEAEAPVAVQGPPASPIRPEHLDKDRERADYFSFITKPYAPPSLELNSPVREGLLSSIRSRMSRRSSSASTGPSSHRSFRDKAMGVMHPPSQPPPQQLALEMSTPRSVPYTIQRPNAQSPEMPREEFARLPKAARILGEYNAETMQSQASQSGSRPSEGSSTSSYHDESSMPPSPASTPDTSRPQSVKGLSAAIEEVRDSSPKDFLPSEEDLTVIAYLASASRDSSKARETAEDTQELRRAADFGSGSRPTSRGRPAEEPERPGSKDRVLANMERPSSQGRVLDDIERPSTRGRILEDVQRPGSQGRVLEAVDRPRTRGGGSYGDGSATPRATDSADSGIGTMDDRWSRTAMPIDIDAQSAVISLATVEGLESSASLVPDPLRLDPPNLDVPILNYDHSRPSSKHSRKGEEATEPDANNDSKEDDRPRSREARGKEKKSSSHAKQMSVVKEEPKAAASDQEAEATNAHELASGGLSSLSTPRQEPLVPPRAKGRSSTASSASSTTEQHRTYAKPPFLPAEPLSSGRNSPSAAYLQEARRSAPLVSSPLSNISRPMVSSPAPPVTAARPGLKASLSTPAVSAIRAPLLPPAPTTAGAPQFRIPAQEPEQLAKPIAKMLVECCHCKFFHDMPSRVYECMAQPDAVVTDRALGVSGAITTSVKCPWCSHNMSTQCCAGYAALVYLTERLH